MKRDHLEWTASFFIKFCETKMKYFYWNVGAVFVKLVGDVFWSASLTRWSSTCLYANIMHSTSPETNEHPCSCIHVHTRNPRNLALQNYSCLDLKSCCKAYFIYVIKRAKFYNLFYQHCQSLLYVGYSLDWNAIAHAKILRAQLVRALRNPIRLHWKILEVFLEENVLMWQPYDAVITKSEC